MRKGNRARRGGFRIALTLSALGIASVALVAHAQQGLNTVGGFIGRAVGGVAIDADGVLKSAQIDDLNRLHDLRAKAMAEVPGDLRAPNEMRKVSLRGLVQAIDEAGKNNRPLPDEVLCLAGLQRIRYVFVYPEQHDIVLAGFGEGWKIADDGSIVGLTTGRPVLQLDDLRVALTTAMEAAQGGITCSIDPTAEGLTRYNEVMKHQTTLGPAPDALLNTLAQAMGPQVISVTGVPDTTHFARVLVAADYRMKRIAMNFDPSPIASLPSFLQMMRTSGGGKRAAMPRWWMATNYKPLLTDKEGLAWELRGQGVKAMTEESFLSANGQKTRAAKPNAAAQKWADRMTEQYDELSAADPIFGELRNCMDLAVISALLFKEHLPERAGFELGSLTTGSYAPPLMKFAAPKEVDSQSSFVQKGDNTIISVSGGVQIDSWNVADRKETSDKLASVHDAATPTAEATASSWWRN